MPKKHNEIIMTEKSPYYLVEISHIEDENGNPIQAKTVQSFCRCGHSKKKPYCDGSHVTEGMDNAKGDMKYMSKWLRFPGEQIVVFFNPALCCHKGVCGKIAPEAFNVDRRPWIMPDLSPVDVVKEAVAKCPSGALYYAIGDEKFIDFHNGNRVRIRSKGSMECRGIRLIDDRNSSNELLSKDRFVLCTCGKSKNKPFCDGAHNEEGLNKE